jgi:hypothetical protein
MLLPKVIAQIHGLIIEKYLETDHNKNLNTTLKRVWMKKQDDTIIPVNINIQTCISETHGIILTAFVNPYEEIVSGMISCKPD